MADASLPGSQGPALLPVPRDALLIEVEGEVRKAHSIVASLLDRNHPRPTAISLVQCALCLRTCIALLEGERIARPRPGSRFVAPRELTLRAFAEAVLRDSNLNFDLRLAADAALHAKNGPPRTAAGRLCELIDFVRARENFLNISTSAAIASLKETQEWRTIDPSRVARAVRLHAKALRALGESDHG